MTKLAKKISFIIFSAVIIIFMTNVSFANNNMLHKAADSAKNGVDHTQNAMQDTSNTLNNVANGAKQAVENTKNNTENALQDLKSGTNKTMERNKNGMYNVSRTATTETASEFSNGTVWSWIIVIAVVLAIAFLIWYLVKRNRDDQ